MAHPSRSSIRRLLAVSGIAAVTLVAAGPGSFASGASPSAPPGGPQPSVEVPGQLRIQAWIDTALPPDVPDGQSVTIGVTLWDPTIARLAPQNGAYLKVHPAKGDDEPSVAAMQADWPGHLTATVKIPDGGLGRIEVGLQGRVCDASGVCGVEEAPFTMMGIGPPPDAPRSALVSATMQPLDAAQPGRPLIVTVILAPLADWDPASLGLPHELVVVASPPRGTDIARAPLRANESVPGLYTGSITIPTGGDVALRVAIPGEGGVDEFVPSLTTRVSLPGGGGARATPGPATAPGAAPAGDGLPLLPIAAALALVVVGALVTRRAFADL